MLEMECSCVLCRKSEKGHHFVKVYWDAKHGKSVCSAMQIPPPIYVLV